MESVITRDCWVRCPRWTRPFSLPFHHQHQKQGKQQQIEAHLVSGKASIQSCTNPCGASVYFTRRLMMMKTNEVIICTTQPATLLVALL
ncbi:hypothetical protein ZHAS_00015465 [Anopheles sinensis]|uniref:Uncharacterized protein n=1 Tax=Anopheles sinensis TaxID=74873 RepID=A0A084WBB5_ANOSI|nr:hypothetical protein ZHAS_00015465 [Anopheles sinensis]